MNVAEARRWAFAIGARLIWGLSAWLCLTGTSQTQAGAVLLVFGAAWAAAMFLTPRVVESLGDGAIDQEAANSILSEGLLKWIGLCILSVCAMLLDLGGYLQSVPFLAICFLGLTLQLMFRRISNHFLSRRQDIGLSVLVLISTCLSSSLGVQDAQLSLVLCALLILLLNFRDLWALYARIRAFAASSQYRHQICTDVRARTLPFANIVDLPILLFLCTEIWLASSYVVARGICESLNALLGRLGEKSLPILTISYQPGNLSSFRSAAARVNLGYLLIGGGAAILVLGGTSAIGELAQDKLAPFPEILMWLLLGQCSPVIFGATGVLMEAGRLNSIRRLIDVPATLLTGMVLFFVGGEDMVAFSCAFAICQLARSGLSAAILGLRFGVWPGLTAVLFRQLKLI